MGIYNEGGNLLEDTGVVARSGASVIQMPSITAFTLGRGRYWLGLAYSSTSGTGGYGWNAPTCGADSAKWLAIGEEALGSTQVPATMTPVASARSVIPNLGIMRA